MQVLETKTLTISIDAAYERVAADLADPMTHPEWAYRFFAGPATRASSSNEVLVPVPMMGGTVRYRVDADPDRGLFDLYLAREGEAFGPPIPVRLIRNGTGATVLWTLTRLPDTPDEGWQGAIAAMSEELEAFKSRHENLAPRGGEA